MRILLVHNYYQQAGGEGQVFKAEANLLEAHGHQVLQYTLHNDQLAPVGPLTTAVKTIWNRQVYQTLHDLIQQENIQIVHFHNTFPLISPAAYYAAKAAGAAVVQTLHNYRLLCPNALFFRDEKPCEDCLGKSIPWPGIVHKCYRDSLVASGGVATLLSVHRLMKTWANAVDAYIALSPFAKEKLIEGGIPSDKIKIKPNFIDPDPGYQPQPGQYALFVGRLSPEKGIDTLLSAWAELGQSIPLKIVGDGPLANKVAEAAADSSGIEWLGRCPMEEVYQHMKSALFLVFPSRWYEGLPRTIIESFAVGTPVLASDLGVMSSIVKSGYSGWHFQAGSAPHLIQVVERLLSDPQALKKIRKTTRQSFDDSYSAAKNYEQLIEIYQSVDKPSLSPALL
ncbi:MAG: glycosyltransferase family 4 protein [Phormidesmis sp.]